MSKIDLFPERKLNTKPTFPVGIVLNRVGTAGEIGLEIEIEGKNLPKNDCPAPWLYKHDGSLRGEDSAEYVLNGPILFKDVPKTLNKLWAKFKTKKSRLDDSNRTSVHVHLNCQNFHLARLASMTALYFISEEILTEYCGEYRVGNLFCLRAKDANGIVTHIRKFLEADGNYRIHDGLHYAGFNIQALQKFGSVEIRTLRGTSDPKVIEEWVGIIKHLYNKSEEFKDPRDICALFSCNGPIAFFYEIFGDKAFVLKQAIKWSDEQLSDSLLEGIRYAQDLCYCKDWSLYKQYDLKPDPFNRDMRTIMNKILNEEGESTIHVVTTAYGEVPSASLQQALSSLTAQSPTWVTENDEVPIPDWDD